MDFGGRGRQGRVGIEESVRYVLDFESTADLPFQMLSYTARWEQHFLHTPERFQYHVDMGFAEAFSWLSQHRGEEADRDVIPRFDVAQDALFGVQSKSEILYMFLNKCSVYLEATCICIKDEKSPSNIS